MATVPKIGRAGVPPPISGGTMIAFMLSYEVTIELDDASLASALEEYMRGRHIADVLATGCFVDGRFERSESGTYRSRYTAASQGDLDRYLGEQAPRLRDDFRQHFPAGLRVGRAVWHEVTGSAPDTDL